MDIYRKAFYQEISQLHQPIINWSVLFIWVQWLTYSWNLGLRKRQLSKQKREKRLLRTKINQRNKVYKDWFSKLDYQEKLNWRHKEMTYERVLRYFPKLAAKGILDSKSMVQTLIVSTVFDNGQLKMGAEIDSKSLTMQKVQPIIQKYQLPSNTQKVNNCYDQLIQLLIRNWIIVYVNNHYVSNIRFPE